MSMQLYGVRRPEGAGDDGLYDRLRAVATPDRRARADRLRRPHDAWHCLLAGALLHHALVTAGIAPALALDPPLAVGTYGKPYVIGCPDFHFNLSHGGDWAVLAWDTAPVGVDIESIRGTRDVRALAARYFTADEQEYVAMASTDAAMAERFYALWTAKEAYLKYTGKGLSRGTATPSLLTDGPVADGVYLTRRRMTDGHLWAVCGRSTVEDLRILTPEALLRGFP